MNSNLVLLIIKVNPLVKMDVFHRPEMTLPLIFTVKTVAVLRLIQLVNQKDGHIHFGSVISDHLGCSNLAMI